MCIAIHVKRFCCRANDRKSNSNNHAPVARWRHEATRLEEARQCYAGAAKLAPEVRLYAVLAGQAPGPQAGPLLLPSPELAPAASARAGTQIPGFGVSSVPLPEDPNPLKRIQQ